MFILSARPKQNTIAKLRILESLNGRHCECVIGNRYGFTHGFIYRLMWNEQRIGVWMKNEDETGGNQRKIVKKRKPCGRWTHTYQISNLSFLKEAVISSSKNATKLIFFCSKKWVLHTITEWTSERHTQVHTHLFYINCDFWWEIGFNYLSKENMVSVHSFFRQSRFIESETNKFDKSMWQNGSTCMERNEKSIYYFILFFTYF